MLVAIRARSNPLGGSLLWKRGAPRRAFHSPQPAPRSSRLHLDHLWTQPNADIATPPQVSGYVRPAFLLTMQTRDMFQILKRSRSRRERTQTKSADHQSRPCNLFDRNSFHVARAPPITEKIGDGCYRWAWGRWELAARAASLESVELELMEAKPSETRTGIEMPLVGRRLQRLRSASCLPKVRPKPTPAAPSSRTRTGQSEGAPTFLSLYSAEPATTGKN